jgi:hypothetical protein
MTTESLSPASRIVIDTFSRPPGERSTSISLTGGDEEAARAPSEVPRGATSAGPTLVAEPSSWNEAPATKGADGCAPNGLDCVVDGTVDSVESGARPSGVLALDPAGATGEAELEARANGAATSGFRPPRPPSCEAGRARLGRFGECGGGATGSGVVVLAIGGTVSARGCVGRASARETPLASTLLLLISALDARLPAPGGSVARPRFPSARTDGEALK